MKTNADGWPVYEDTGEIMEEGVCFTLWHPHESVQRENVVEVRRMFWPKGSTSQILIRTDTTAYDASCNVSYFRHPHNAVAAWLKAVSGEEDK